jgi:hypothetical protein
MVGRVTRITALVAAALALTGVSLLAQALVAPDGVELSGSWAARNMTEALGQNPGRGPRPVDYMGIPLNETGRAGALAYSPSALSMPERICAFYTPPYIAMGPMGLKIWNESELRTGATTAWVIGGWADFVPIPIFMDGRPHPSKLAPHLKSGFTTGRWIDDVLTTHTTHMEKGTIRRNGVPHSDQATMTARFSRHDDILTITVRVDDPVNLTEPFYLSRTFVSANTPINPAAYPCTPTDEGVPPETVAHYLPEKNPFVDEMTRLYGIPQEAVLGGAETMYPEFRRKIREKYVRPQKCIDSCGGPGLYPPVN